MNKLKTVKEFKVKKTIEDGVEVITLPPIQLGQIMFANGVTGEGVIMENEKPHEHNFIQCDEWSRTCVCGATE